MGFFAKAVVSGFAFSLGAALFKKFSAQLGLENEAKKKDETVEQAGEEQASEPLKA